MKVKELRPREGETQEHGHQASFELYEGLFPYSPTWEACRPCSCSLTRGRPASLTQEALSGFAEEVGTAFVSLVVSGRVVAATESWWRLGMPEAVLLPWLVGSLPPQAARDYPVYLPHGSPTVSEWVGRAGGNGEGWEARARGGTWSTASRRPGLRREEVPLLQVPHRLLTLTLLPDLELCLLCGPRPHLSQLDAQVNRGSVPLCF